ncbi:MAG: hypothetical protein JSR37_02810 [Verrucomicrobia bacterium]|nr:hypothetical protein [Verrucomicrobiota bacterium]MBS0636100.1 hypothetical protein [Verrucomicrobiota bacterium]
MNPIGTTTSFATVTSPIVPQSILDRFKESIGIFGMQNLDAILAQIPTPLEITLDRNDKGRPMMRLSYPNNQICNQCLQAIMSTKLPQTAWSPECAIEEEVVVTLSFDDKFCANFPKTLFSDEEYRYGVTMYYDNQ